MSSLRPSLSTTDEIERIAKNLALQRDEIRSRIREAKAFVEQAPVYGTAGLRGGARLAEDLRALARLLTDIESHLDADGALHAMQAVDALRRNREAMRQGRRT